MARASADVWISSNLPAIAAAEASTLGTKARFHQCLESHVSVPDSSVAPDRLAVRTSDTNEGWNNLPGAGLAAMAIPLSVSITVYDGPLGKGWELVARTKEGIRSYRRIVGSGPESGLRDRDWTEEP